MEITKHHFYDLLCETVDGCVKKSAFAEFMAMKKVLVIGTNIESRMQFFFRNLYAVNPDIQLIIVAQEQMLKALAGVEGKQYEILAWNGPYGERLIELIRSREDFPGIDAMVYFSAQPVNMRDSNILHIAMELEKTHSIRLYSLDAAEELYEYQDITLYNKGLMLYQEINDFIEMALSKKNEECSNITV